MSEIEKLAEGLNFKPSLVPLPDADPKEEVRRIPPIRFVASTNEEHYSSDFYESRRHAVEEFPEEEGLDPEESFWVGEALPPSIPSINVERIVEDAVEFVGEEVGESAQDWLDGLTGDQTEDLRKRMGDVFEDWLRHWNLMPTCYKVESVRTHSVGETEHETGR